MKMKVPILSLLILCVLLIPALAFGTATLPAASGSVTSFVNSTKGMVKYAYAFSKASAAQDYLDIVTDSGFQQDVETLIDSYYDLLSSGLPADSLTEKLSFQESVNALLGRAETLSSASAAAYSSLVSNRDFLQDILNFIDSYYRLPASLYADTAAYDDWTYSDWTYDDSQQYGFYPVYALRTGISAALTMKMATRLGPNTAYSEELGTFPQTTSIRVFEQAMGNDVPWVMVEFLYRGRRYRAYTGMKRISADETVPWGNAEPTRAITLSQTEAYYGPGYDYAKHQASVPANTYLEVYEVENGFLLCDFQRDDELIRAYIPWDSRIE